MMDLKRQRQQQHSQRSSGDRNDVGATPGRQTLVGSTAWSAGHGTARGRGAEMWQRGVSQANEMRLAIEAQSQDGATSSAQATAAPSHADPAVPRVDREDAVASEQETLRGLLDVVTQSFHWFNEAAQEMEEELRRDLRKEDEPSWLEELAAGALTLAVGGGAAAVGKFLAEKLTGAEQLVHGATHAATDAGAHQAGSHIGKGFVEHLFSEGSAEGVKEGLSKLNAGKNGNVIDPFIDAQKKGVWGAAMANQTNWLTHGRRNVHTVEDATRLKEACSKENVIEAAEKQYQASRDAWVSYLAQARFGAVGKDGPVTQGSVNVGSLRTDMSTQAQRDRDAKVAPGYREATDAPDLSDAMHGNAPGVLEVVAHLPEISTAVPGADVTNSMEGAPQVRVAILNGVNQDIRRHYEGVPLADMHVPRQINAQVDGAPDFTLNIDEQGNANVLHRNEATWLRSRATVGHAENTTLSDFEKQKKGRELLLNELVPGSISKERV